MYLPYFKIEILTLANKVIKFWTTGHSLSFDYCHLEFIWSWQLHKYGGLFVELPSVKTGVQKRKKKGNNGCSGKKKKKEIMVAQVRVPL